MKRYMIKLFNEEQYTGAIQLFFTKSPCQMFYNAAPVHRNKIFIIPDYSILLGQA